MHGSNPLAAHLFQGLLHGLALRIDHGLFWRNDNFCFHAKTGRARKPWGNVEETAPRMPALFQAGLPASRRGRQIAAVPELLIPQAGKRKLLSPSLAVISPRFSFSIHAVRA